MEAIENVTCLRGNGPRALCEHVGAVAGDHLDAGMAAQLSGNTLGLATGRLVNAAVALQINDHGAVASAAPPNPLVHTDDLRLWARWHGRSAHEA